jgi:hypothetical protein
VRFPLISAVRWISLIAALLFWLIAPLLAVFTMSVLTMLARLDRIFRRLETRG